MIMQKSRSRVITSKAPSRRKVWRPSQKSLSGAIPSKGASAPIIFRTMSFGAAALYGVYRRVHHKDLKVKTKIIDADVDSPIVINELLQGYQQAAANSRKTGKPFNFQIHVDHKRGIIGFLRDDPVPSKHIPTPESRLDAALSAARERGRIRAAEIVATDDMVTGDRLAKRLGMSRMAVNTKRQNGQLLGLAGAKRGFRYPVWQLDAEGKPYAELAALHERLGGPWEVYRFLVQQHPELQGLTGREALERKKGRAALKVAGSLASDFS